MFKPVSIDEFKALISKGGGFAKSNLYYVHIPFTVGETRSVGFFCKSITLPSRQLNTINREVGIDNQKTVYGHQFNDVSMTFRVLNDQVTRQFFEEWQKAIVKPVTDGNEANYDIAFPDSYVGSIHIYQLERGVSFPAFNRQKDVSLGPININLDLDIDIGLTGKTVYHWVLERAYPVTFQSETLSDDNKDQISEINVEFAYKSWSGERVSGKGSLGITGSAQVSADIANVFTKKIYDFLNG